MNQKHLLQKYQENKLHLENHISQLWLDYLVPSETLLSAMKFSLDGPSKRIRGTLFLLVSQAITGTSHHKNLDSLSLSAILEMIHAYSLVHDDLPGMDDSPTRRGKPSCHVQFGEGMATLVGDALLTYAFENLFHLNIPPETVILIGKILSKVCGSQGMVGGQAMDIQLQQNIFLQESTLQTIHQKKTGELICASVVLPSYMHEKKWLEKKLHQFGSFLGLIFQIKDDILDANNLKNSSEKEGPNYVSILGLEKTQEKLIQISEKAFKTVEELDIPHPEILTGICEFMLNRES